MSDNKYELAIVSGDLSKLTTEERLAYYKKTCESLNLNPLSKPFDYINLNGKLTLYATRTATDQLRMLHKVSLKITNREIVNDCYVVTVQASLPDGRADETSGAVFVGSAKGDSYANAIMKAETKAKRRATLSICGLGMIDESEIESIPNIKTVEPEKPKAITETYTLDQAIDKIKSILGQDKEYVVGIIEKAFASKKIDQSIYEELHSIVFEYYDDRTDDIDDSSV
jgi:hypothetical protein